MVILLLFLSVIVAQAQPWDTPVKLWPHASVVGAGTVTVNWAQPIPPRMLYDATDVQILSGGVEITAYVAAIHDHRVLPPATLRGLNVPAIDDLEPGIKAVHIQVQRSFSTASSVELTVRVGVARTLNQATLFSAVTDTYVASNIVPPCEDPTFKAGDQCASIKEPRVLVTHEPRWMAVSNLVAFASPMGYTPTSQLDAAQINWFGSLTNRNWNPTQEAIGQLTGADLTTPCTDGTKRYITDGATTTSCTGGGAFWVGCTCAVGGGSWTGANDDNAWIRIVGTGPIGDNTTQHSDGWQYDRVTFNFWIPYIRTGSPHFLRQAIKETLLYESLLWAGEGRIESTGMFAPQNLDTALGFDQKYSLTQPFAMLRYLYGDYRQDAVEDVEYAFRVTKPHMEAADDHVEAGSSTVTSRDVANAAHSLAYAYEMTGSITTLTTLQSGLTAIGNALTDGDPSVPAGNRGCHHFWEGAGQKYSAWKGAMLSISLAEIYRITAEAAIPDMLTALAGCLASRGILLDCAGCGNQTAGDHVTAGDNIASQSTAPGSDSWESPKHEEEHTLDVAAAIAIGYYFDQTQTAWRTAVDKLLITAVDDFDFWTRSSNWPGFGAQLYRTSPIRKRGWLFREGYTLPWTLYGPPDWNGPKPAASASSSAGAAPDPLNITSSLTLPGGVVSSAYSVQLLAEGGTTPYTWTVTAGALPAGLSLATNGIISGTPTTEETTTPTIQVADSGVQTDSDTFSITITAAPVLTFTTLTPTNLGIRTLLDDWKTALGNNSGTVCGTVQLDYTQDGLLDVVASVHTGQDTRNALMLKATGSGLTFVDGFADSGIPTANLLPICDWGPYVLDIDGNGYMDIIGNSDEQETPIFLGQSDGTFNLDSTGDTGSISTLSGVEQDSVDGYLVISQARRSLVTQSGSVSTTGTAVTRSGGESFLTALAVGETILFRCEDPDLWRVVTAIADADNLTIDEALPSNVSGCAWSSEKYRVVSAKWSTGSSTVVPTSANPGLHALVPLTEVVKVHKAFRDRLIAGSQTGTTQFWAYLDTDYAGKDVDLNEDGLQDVIFTVRGHSGSNLGNSYGVCINQGDGTCLISTTPVGRAEEVIDIDGDGHQDLIVRGPAATPSNTYGLFLGDGTGALTHAPSNFSSNVHTQSYDNGFIFADLDNDTDLDVVHYRGRISNARVHRNDGNGAFTQVINTTVWPYVPSGAKNNPIVYDFDRDGLLDVMLDGPGRGGTSEQIDITLYHNTTSGAGNYCKVNLRQPGTPNPFALTATFEWWPAGTRVGAGPPKWSLSPPWNGEPIHVGLGAGVALDYRITWPDATQVTADSVACDNTTITVNKT